MQSRRHFLATTGALAAGSLLPRGLWAGDPAPGGKRPNVLFLAVDDLRPQLGCYGHARMQTPHIDALARSGLQFDRAYCNVPVCGASRASLLTGLRPGPTRFLGFSTRKDEDAPAAVSLPAQFKANGYTTLSLGKIYHHRKDDLGAWSEEPWGEWQAPDRAWYGRGYADPDLIAELKAADAAKRKKHPDQSSRQLRLGQGPACEIGDVDDSAYPDGAIAGEAIARLRQLENDEAPFFLAVGFKKPHLPFAAPRPYWELYDRDEIDLADNPFRPEGAPDVALHNWGELRNYTDIPRRGDLDEAKRRELVHGYYAATSFVDAQIGRVLDELDRLGLREDTIVVLWGDHGWNLGEHGLWCKHCNFHTSLHAPLLLRVPGTPGGRRSRALVEFVDLYPTLCELAGVPVPAVCQGSSMAPLLTRPERPWKQAVFSRFLRGDSIVSDHYLYTLYRKNNGRGAELGEMLYDHEVDPHENVNVVDHPDYTAIAERLRGQLAAGWERMRPVS